MLKLRKCSDWLLMSAILLFLGFWSFALSGLLNSSLQPPHHIEINTSNTSASKEAPKPDERLADYTLWLTIFTGGLVFVAAIQIRYLIRADRIASTAAETASRQTKILEAQHLAANRPRLKVSHVFVGDKNGNPTVFFGHGEISKGGLRVANIGGGDARIIESSYKVIFDTIDLPIQSPLDSGSDGHTVLPGTTLGIGKSVACPLQVVIDIGTLRKMSSFVTVKDGAGAVYVIGQIRYQDDGGNDRFIGFCRGWRGSGHFQATENPDYEYED